MRCWSCGREIGKWDTYYGLYGDDCGQCMGCYNNGESRLFMSNDNFKIKPLDYYEVSNKEPKKKWTNTELCLLAFSAIFLVMFIYSIFN